MIRVAAGEGHSDRARHVGTQQTGRMKLRHVILDRDGVLNIEAPSGWLATADEWRWERGALAGMALLATLGVRVSVATNQSGIGRGAVPASAVESIHLWLGNHFQRMGVDFVGIFMCPHAPWEGCACRKPKPLLVTQALNASGVAASETVMIGDAARDIQAAATAGVSGILVATGKGAQTADLPGIPRYADLAAAVSGLPG